MTDTAVTLMAFGIVLLLNIITIIVVHCTKDDIYYLGKKTTWQKIWFHAYFLLVGCMYYPTVGISKLVQWIRK